MLVDRSTVTGNQALSGGGDSGVIQNFGDNEDSPRRAHDPQQHDQREHGAPRRRRAQLERRGQHHRRREQHDRVQHRGQPRPRRSAGSAGSAATGSFTFAGSIVSGNVFGNGPSNCSGARRSRSGATSRAARTAASPTRPISRAPIRSSGRSETTADHRHARAASRRAPPSTRSAADCPDRRRISAASARPQGDACDIGAFELVPPPANDDWSDRATLDGDAGGQRNDGRRDLEPGEPKPSESLQESVWYSWTPSVGRDRGDLARARPRLPARRV